MSVIMESRLLDKMDQNVHAFLTVLIHKNKTREVMDAMETLVNAASDTDYKDNTEKINSCSDEWNDDIFPVTGEVVQSPFYIRYNSMFLDIKNACSKENAVDDNNLRCGQQ